MIVVFINNYKSIMALASLMAFYIVVEGTTTLSKPRVSGSKVD